MNTGSSESIFKTLYSKPEFVDRYLKDPSLAVDVVVPIIHTNELWESNLLSFYREIPINRLIISDGGCIDNSIEIAKKFPRVHVLDHKQYKSLGYCIRKLIEEVETEWFIYPHSDVYLPEGWFDKMRAHQGEYDWFGCPMQHVVMVEYPMPPNPRPYAGSQMGRKAAFMPNLSRIDDDFVYRQEDYVFEKVVSDGGFKNGKIEDTFHYHQTMHRPSKWGRKVTGVQVNTELSDNEKVRVCETQAKGIIKYLSPEKKLANIVMAHLAQMISLGTTDFKSFQEWVRSVNPAWLPYIRPWTVRILVWLQFPKIRPIKKRVIQILQTAE